MARSVEGLIDEIDLLASRGLPRKEFFAELAPRVRTVIDNDASCWHTLDPHTVEDHTKSLYDKVGVASRQELVARVFLDEYLPEVDQSTPLTSRGRFDRF